MAPEAMVDQARMFGAQLRAAAPLARGLLTGRGPFDNVAFCGLGGSAAGGRLAVALLDDELRVPVAIPSNVALPGWVGRRTLVVVTSYSGATIEALDWWEEAGALGATRVALTSGGELARRAAASSDPLVLVEAGYQPRGALGLLLAPLLVLLGEAGVAADPIALIERGAEAADAASARLSDAHAAAALLAGGVSVLYGSGLRAAVAVRLKNQLNENAKVHAFAGTIPEIAHNEILGWLQGTRVALRHAAILLRDPDEPAGVARLTDELGRLIASDGGQVLSWSAAGADERTRAFGLLAFGDLVSCLLAEEEHVDPLDIARLTALKAALAAHR